MELSRAKGKAVTAQESARRGRQPSMGDVAKHAGVSSQTVSRVSNGHANVDPATRQRVIEAARDHEEWETFSRRRLDEGARLSDYYPLTPDTRGEYEAWRSAQALAL